MKIVWVVPGIYLAGGIRIIVEYANRLQELGHDVSILSIRHVCEDPCFRVDVPVFLKEDRDKITSDADAVIATGDETVETVLKCSGKGRRYHFIQNRDSYFSSRLIRQRRIERMFEAPLIPITISHWMAGVMKLYGKESFVIHNGLDTNLFRETPGLRPGHFRVVAEGHGSWAPWKRLDMGIAAAREAGASEVWALTFKNTPEGVDKAFVEIESSEVAKLYSSCTAMVKLSDFEGYPAPQAEAMACGCPVVTTMAPGTMEYCIDGENCLLVPPGDLNAAVEALRRINGDPELRLKLIEGGRRTVNERFSWQNKAEAMAVALSGKVHPSEIICPFHSHEEQERIITASQPYSLPYWESIKVLGKNAPYGDAGIMSKLFINLYSAIDKRRISEQKTS